MQTRQHLEQLDSDLISPGEFDHNYRTYSMNLHPEKIKGHTNSAYRVFLKNNKQLTATCGLCDRMAKHKIPQISKELFIFKIQCNFKTAVRKRKLILL